MNLQDRAFAIKKMFLGALMKIFLDYTQTMAILNNLHLDWNQKLSDMFSIQKTFSGGIHQVIALECFAKGSTILTFFKYINF